MDIETLARKGKAYFCLHGSDMLKYAFENQSEWEKSLLNISAFDTHIKELVSNVMESKRDNNKYVVLDLAQTASSFLQENQINCVKNENMSWERYMDEYIDCISQYFEHDSIILVRVSIPKIRANYKIIRPFFSNNNDHVSAIVKLFEDYFISKVNPYVVDISKFYFLENDHKDAGSSLCFETLYNQDIFNKIEYIVINSPKERVFETPNYEYTLQRFLKVYNNLYDKNKMFTLFDKTNLIDLIVLNLNYRIIKNNISDICELKNSSYSSYKDIINRHDFKENEELKEVVVLVSHILNMDITNPNLDYTIVFKEDLKVKKSLAVQVNQKLKELGLINDTIVTIFNVEMYHNVLLLYLNRQYKKAMKELLHVYNEVAQPILIDSWGSCISRVPLNLDTGKYKVNKFINRSCFLNEFDEPIDVSKIDFFDTSVGGGGWYNRCFRDSLEKVSKNKIEESKAQWLIVDFFDTINDLAVFRNAIIDFSEDNRNTDFLKKVIHECKPFAFYDKPDDYIKERIDKFINLIKNKYHHNIILVNLVVREHYLDGKRQIQTLEVKDIRQKNEFIEKWQKYFCNQTGCYCIDLAKFFLADDQSIYGTSIVHYEEAFNQEVFRYVDYIIQKQPKKKMFDNYSKALKVQRLIELKKNNFDLSLVKPLFQYYESDEILFDLSIEKLLEIQKQENLQYQYLKMNAIR